MSHDLWLWFSSLLVLEKTFENRRDELLSGIYQNFFISVRILSIMYQNLTWVGLPSLCWYVTEVKVLYLLPSVSVWSYSSLMIWNHFIGAEAITYRKINWWNTSLNILVLAVFHVDYHFGLMNYFNWFIYYHVTALRARKTLSLFRL